MNRQTNIEFISHIMDYSKSGAMMQLFIMHAIEAQSDRVVADRKKVIENMKDGFISGEAWVECAKELQDLLDDRYER